MALTGKIAIVTGASSGIGEGIAKEFAKEGAKLSLAGRNKENLQAVAGECRKHCGDDIVTTIGDLTKKATREALVQNTIDKFGKIDILVNNAGIILITPLAEMTEDVLDEQLDVNLKTPILLTVLAAPKLKESKGCVLNISSTFSAIPVQKVGAYCISKAAMDMYTKILARELGPVGVRVNSLNPGYVDTKIYLRGRTDEVAPTVSDSFKKHVPLGRNGTLEDMAKIATFMVSDATAWVTGETFVADGGLALQHAIRM